MGTDDVTMTYFGNIVKTEKTPDGHLYVYGKAAGPELDLDEQRCDPTWLKTEMPDWMKWANVREQHTQLAAGVGKELEEDGQGGWFLKSLVVDRGTIEKVEKGVLKGYSIGVKGGRVVKSASAPKGMIVGGKIVEISLVDRPANPDATISICKAAGAGTLVPVDGDGEEVELVKWLTPDMFKSAAIVVDDVLDGAYDEAEYDEVRAAVDTIADKLIAEAMMLKAADLTRPYDISGAVSAVNALEMFIDEDESEARDIAKRFFSQEKRDSMANSGAAMDDGSFPINNAEDVRNAVRLSGHHKNHSEAEVRAHIVRRAKAVGAEGEIPEGWESGNDGDEDDKVTKAVTADLVKAAVAEVNKAWEAKFESLSDELAKVRATPVPYGPVVIPPRTAMPALNKSSKADVLLAQASQPGLDPTLANLYAQAAREEASAS